MAPEGLLSRCGHSSILDFCLRVKSVSVPFEYWVAYVLVST
ncbi:rCG54097 [Rattus norvegicus]|uniref:RCG54097 n=1 Tax=Rattus norvegicus TaxID=10116 RepID=A6J8G1_RAT|nr:rCG54097 [Rattus norvegicus]